MIRRSTSSLDWREARRKRALELRHQGWHQSEIAVALGVSDAAVSHWMRAVQEHGEAEWRSWPRSGRPAKITPEQRQLIPDLLSHGAEAYGFRGEVWTCGRVASVIAREFGVMYHKAHVSRLLKSLEWTPHKPVTRARQRDDVAIERWRTETWPSLKKKARSDGKAIVFVDESGFYLLPGLVRTYAPRGQRVVLRRVVARDHLSVMSGITMSGQLYTLVRDDAFTSAEVIGFLFHLFRHLGDLLVVWDGSPIHRGEVDAFLAAGGAPHIHVEQLPPYAPDLNPDEAVWQYLKHVELRNVCCADLRELRWQLDLATKRLRAKTHIVRSFFGEAKLSLE